MKNELATVKIWHLLPTSFPTNLIERDNLQLKCCGRLFDEVYALVRFAPTKVGFTTKHPTCQPKGASNE